MAGKAPLLLAAFLFGIGASGLLILSFADRAAWGPFRPAVQPQPPQRVIVIEVGTPVAPPALEGLFAGGAPGNADALAAEPAGSVAGGGDVRGANLPTATPTPVPTLRIHGVAADDAVSAAAATPTPPPPVRVINVAAGEAPGDGE
ncbi:MAG: hypothetical protein K6U88_10235 [Dehalococcoidia bacterium]|nr:hypothetical protein [Dehalococcoidia bacterium]